jgi:hypothetical protein
MKDFKKYMQLQDEEFELLLEQKTGWGKNEVFIAYQKACLFALSRYVDETQEKE